MAIDRTQYIKLYSIAMEEVRHHHRLYTEIWIAAIFMASGFFTALYFLSSFLSSIPSLASMPVRLSIIIFGSLIIVAFYWEAMWRGVIADTCRGIAKKLEDILAGKTPEDAIKLDNLLLTHEIEALQKQRRHVLRLVLFRPWIFFLFGFLILWIHLCLTLLKVGVSP